MAHKGKVGGAYTEVASASALEANPSGPNIVVRSEHTRWMLALHELEGWQSGKYTGKPDPRPLAELLLRSGKPVPEDVAKRLGVLLDPPWGNKGPRLISSVSKRYSIQAGFQTIQAMMSAQQEIERQLQISGKLESAIEEVAKRLVARVTRTEGTVSSA